MELFFPEVATMVYFSGEVLVRFKLQEVVEILTLTFMLFSEKKL